MVRTNFTNLYGADMGSGSQLEAEHTAETLRGHTDRELEGNTDLVDRLQGLELPPGVTLLDNDSRIPTPEIEDETPALPEPTPTQLIPTFEGLALQANVPDLDTAKQESFNEIIASCRVYRRVKGFEIDAMSTVSSTRSHGWSVLSGVTSARLTTIGVICLPLYQSELEQFLAIRSLQMPLKSTPTITGHMTYTLRRLNNELDDLSQGPPDGIAAGPIGDDMVRAVMSCATGNVLTMPQVTLASHYMGPSMFSKSSGCIINKNFSPNRLIQVVCSPLQSTFQKVIHSSLLVSSSQHVYITQTLTARARYHSISSKMNGSQLSEFRQVRFPPEYKKFESVESYTNKHSCSTDFDPFHSRQSFC